MTTEGCWLETGLGVTKEGNVQHIGQVVLQYLRNTWKQSILLNLVNVGYSALFLPHVSKLLLSFKFYFSCWN